MFIRFEGISMDFKDLEKKYKDMDDEKWKKII